MPPFIDMSDVIVDPDLAGRQIDVIRRAQNLSTAGRVSTRDRRYPGVVAVVTVASPNDLERLDDQQRMGRHLVIVTKFALRGPSEGFQPDLVIWRGDKFVVKTFEPYPQFGAGFYQAIVGSMDIMDQPMPGRGRFDFSDPANSDFIPLMG